MTSEPSPSTSRVPRLRQWYAKMLYIIAGAIIYYLAPALAPTDTSRGILRSVLFLILVLLATRLFRSVAEPDDGPRAWWRMTGRPLAGFVLGVLLGIGAIGLIGVASDAESLKSLRSFRGDQSYIVITAVIFIVLTVLYITSSVRLVGLQRAARAEAERAPRTGSPRSSSKG